MLASPQRLSSEPPHSLESFSALYDVTCSAFTHTHTQQHNNHKATISPPLGGPTDGRFTPPRRAPTKISPTGQRCSFQFPTVLYKKQVDSSNTRRHTARSADRTHPRKQTKISPGDGPGSRTAGSTATCRWSTDGQRRDQASCTVRSELGLSARPLGVRTRETGLRAFCSLGERSHDIGDDRSKMLLAIPRILVKETGQ